MTTSRGSSEDWLPMVKIEQAKPPRNVQHKRQNSATERLGSDQMFKRMPSTVKHATQIKGSHLSIGRCCCHSRCPRSDRCSHVSESEEKASDAVAQANANIWFLFMQSAMRMKPSSVTVTGDAGTTNGNVIIDGVETPKRRHGCVGVQPNSRGV